MEKTLAEAQEGRLLDHAPISGLVQEFGGDKVKRVSLRELGFHPLMITSRNEAAKLEDILRQPTQGE